MSINAGGAFLPSANYTPTGAWDFSGATVTLPTGGTSITATVASSPSAQTNTFLSKTTITGTTTTATNGLNSIRGELDLASGLTISGTSFFTGVYGRANIFGTVDIGSGDLAAVYGKFDLNGATLTSGHIAPVQANIVNPPASAHTAGVALFYGESASGTPIGTGIELYMAADYFLTLTQVSGGSFFGATAPTSLAKSLKIKVGGTDYYIGLYTSAS